MLPLIITYALYCWIINFYDSTFIYFGYLYLILFSVLCSQSLGHISGIIFSNNLKIALLMTASLQLLAVILSNSLIYLKEFHYSLQWFSELSYVKHSFESILVMIYGFNRCSPDKISVILYKYDINDQTFWSNSIKLFLLFIFLRYMSLIALMLKTNTFSILKKTNDLQNSEESMTKLSVSIPGMTSGYN